MGAPEGINATGQPDTPMEVINDLLAKALQATTLEDMKKGVEKAYRISNGLDPYLDRMIPEVPQACQDLIAASSEHDWEGVYNAVRYGLTSMHMCMQPVPPCRMHCLPRPFPLMHCPVHVVGCIRPELGLQPHVNPGIQMYILDCLPSFCDTAPSQKWVLLFLLLKLAFIECHGSVP